MVKHASIRWLRLILAAILLFGSGLQAAWAETLQLKGLVATVEDETGQPLANGQVELYQYKYYYGSMDGAGYYANRLYSAPLKNGELFIPNAYILQGQPYELVVRGASASQSIVYHYSFKGGDINQLNFSKNQLKQLTLTHDKAADYGNLVLTAKSAAGISDQAELPIYQVPFDSGKSVTAWIASNVGIQAYASLYDSTAGVSYLLKKSAILEPNSGSGNLIRFDGDLVQVTPPLGYSASTMYLYTQNMGMYSSTSSAYVSKGLTGSVHFSVVKDDKEYHFNRSNAAFNQDMALELGTAFTGEVRAYTSSDATGSPSIRVYTSFKDSYGNVLNTVSYRNSTTAALSGQKAPVWFMMADGDGEPTRTTIAGEAVSGASLTANNPPSAGSSLLEYELYKGDNLLQSIPADNVYSLSLNGLAQGTYRLKLVKQAIPEDVFKLTLDQTFNTSNKVLGIDVPQGYTFAGLKQATIWQLEGDRIVRGLGVGKNELGLNLYEEFNPNLQYQIYASSQIVENNGTLAEYVINQRFSGQELNAMDRLPLQEKLVKNQFSVTGTPITSKATLSLSVPRDDGYSLFSWSSSADSTLFAPPGTYDVSVLGTGGTSDAYHLYKRVTIPDQDIYNVSFTDVSQNLISVELQKNGTKANFQTFGIKPMEVHQATDFPVYGSVDDNPLTVLHTNPGSYRFRFIRSETFDNETPWKYVWETDRQSFSANTVLSTGSGFQTKGFGKVYEYPYTNEGKAETQISTSAIVKNGDLNLNQVYVKRNQDLKLMSSTAREDIREYMTDYTYGYGSVKGMLKVTDANGNVVGVQDTIDSLNSLYVMYPEQQGALQMTFEMPVGPKESITMTQPVGFDPSKPPGKPQPQAAFAGQGLKLTWQPVVGADSYDVYAAEKGRALTKVASGVKDTSYTYSSAQAGKTYDLKVVAVTSKGVTTESDIVTFEVPQFAVSKLDVQADQSSAGLLKLGSKLGIELQGSTGSGISAKAVVSYTQDGSYQTKELDLVAGQGKYTGEFPVIEGMTQIKLVKAYLLKDGTDTKSAELSKELNKQVGATVTGIVKRNTKPVTDKPIVQIVVGNQSVRAAANEDGVFTLAGVPAGKAVLNVESLNAEGQHEYDMNLVKNIETVYGVKTEIGSVNIPVRNNVKVRLLDQDSQPVTKALRVSISGPSSKEGYIDGNGYFTTYSGESELKRLKTGAYKIAVAGEGLYEGLNQEFEVTEGADYLKNPITFEVRKKTKETAEVTVELFLPDGMSTNRVESYYLYSPSVSQAFGWDVGYYYGYNKTMTVSERVYVTNPQHVLGGGTSTTVAEQVYGYLGKLTVPEVVMASDYSLNVSVPNFQPIYKQVSVSASNTTLKAELLPSVLYTGRILDKNGNPITGAEVSASAGTGYAYARTDAEGRYTLQGLAETAQLYMHVKAIGYTNYDESVQAAADHQVPDIALENDQFIHGKIVDKDQKPLKHVYVYAYQSGSSHNGWARTDENGYFKIRGLAPGTYSVNANLYGYPSVTQNFAASANEVTVVMQSQAGIFSGQGNSFNPSVTTIVYGKELTYRLDYKNNSTNQADNTVWNFELQANVKFVEGSVELNGKAVNTSGGALLQVPAGNVAAGQSGSISFKVLVNKADEAAIRTTAYPSVGGNKQEPAYVATTSVLYVTLNAPAVTGDKKIKVYGNTKPGSTVEIYADGLSLGRVKAEGRWWYADVVLPLADNATEAEFGLTAHVVDGDQAGSLSQTSEVATVKYSANVPGVEDVTITAGWNVNVKLNPNISVATFAITEKTPIQTKVTFKEAVDEASISFIGSTYALSKGRDGKTFEGEVPSGWSSYGEQLLTLTYKKNGVSITVPLMEVIVLIDPSGYVFEGSMDNRLPGVTAVVQQEDGATKQWSSWNAQNFGQINPQTTDEQGRYGWDVMQGRWRVLFSKPGFEDYTSRIVVVPPAETQLNVPLVRTTAPTIESVTPANGATKINVNAEIEIVFDRPMNEAGMDNTKIRLLQGDQEIAADLVYEHMKGYQENVDLKNVDLLDSNGEGGWFKEDLDKKLTKKLILKPRTALLPGTSYQVEIKGGLLDYSGKAFVSDSSYSFTTAAADEDSKPAITGGGGGFMPSAAANEALLDVVTLSKSVSNNEVKVALTDKQDTLLVTADIWRTIQSNGYTVKVQQKNAVVTVPAKAFTLQDNEMLVLELKPSDAKYPSGYKAASSVLNLGVMKQKDSKKEPLTASEPLVLKLMAAPTNEPALNGVYAFVNGQPQYLGRSHDIAVNASGTFGLAQFERPFTDVDQHWAQQDIRYLVSHHIVDGATETSFEPSGTTTRGQIAKLFAEMLQLDKTNAKSSFSDVSADAWYAGYVAAVEKAGIFQGADGQFRPDAAISRQELAVVISRLVKQQEQAKDRAFADQAQIADWAQAGVGVAVKLGIIQGDETGKFLPAANATRAEAAAMVHRLIQVLDNETK